MMKLKGDNMMLRSLLTMLLLLYIPALLVALELEPLQKQLQSLSSQIPALTSSSSKELPRLPERILKSTQRVLRQLDISENELIKMASSASVNDKIEDEKLAIEDNEEMWDAVAHQQGKFNDFGNQQLKLVAQAFEKYWKLVLELRAKKPLIDELREEATKAIKTIKTFNDLIRSYRAKYGCATLNGERLNINNSPELWHAVDLAKSFDLSGSTLLEELNKLFTKHWNDILQRRQKLLDEGVTLQLSTGC